MNKAYLHKDKRYALITYEELVSDPVNKVKYICEKLEIKFNVIIIDTSSFEDLDEKKC